MKIRLGALALALFLVAGDYALSQDDPADPNEMMRKIVEASKLTDHHRALGDLVGEWDVKMEVKMPGIPVTPGTMTAEWLIPKRWLVMRLKAPGFMGRPDYESVYVTGYDKIKKKFVSMVVDSMGPAMLTMQGVVVDPTGKVGVQYGTLDEYLTGEHDKPFKLVTRTIDDDNFAFEVWDLGIGEQGKPVIVQTFTRKKK